MITFLTNGLNRINKIHASRSANFDVVIYGVDDGADVIINYSDGVSYYRTLKNHQVSFPPPHEDMSASIYVNEHVIPVDFYVTPEDIIMTGNTDHMWNQIKTLEDLYLKACESCQKLNDEILALSKKFEDLFEGYDV